MKQTAAQRRQLEARLDIAIAMLGVSSPELRAMAERYGISDKSRRGALIAKLYREMVGRPPIVRIL